MENYRLLKLPSILIELRRAELNKENEKDAYYQNGNKILDEYGNEINDIAIHNHISNLVDQFCTPIEHIVLLAGAGASVITDDTGKIDLKYGLTMKELKDAVFTELENMRKENKSYNFDELSQMISFLKNKEDANLEDFLSALIASEVFIKRGKKKYKESINVILQIIKNKTSYNYDPKIFKHASLIKKLSSRLNNQNRLSIVTTNYDTLFEDAADTIDYTVFDGFNFTYSPKFNSDMFEWNLTKPITDMRSNKMEYKKSVINLLKIHGSLTWMRTDLGEVIRKDKQEIRNPLMIFPSSNKYMQSYETPYFALFSKFQDLLKIKNTLLITTGFSFADNHIAKMICQAIKQNLGLSVLVCDYSIEPELKCENWKDLIQLQENGFRIGFCKATLHDRLTMYLGVGEKND